MLKALFYPIPGEKKQWSASHFAIFICAILVLLFIFTLQALFLFFAVLTYFILVLSKEWYNPFRWVALNFSTLFNGKGTEKTPKVILIRIAFFLILLGANLINILISILYIEQGNIAVSFFVVAVLDLGYIGCLFYFFWLYLFSNIGFAKCMFLFNNLSLIK